MNVTIEGIEAISLLGQENSIKTMCRFHSMENVRDLIESLGIPLRTVSKTTKKRKSGDISYVFTTSIPIGNPFLLICDVSSRGSGMSFVFL